MGVGFILMSAICIAPVYLVAIYCWYKLENLVMDWKSPKIYIAWLIMTVLATIINLFTPRILKILLIVIMLLIINYCFILKNIEKSIATVLVLELASMVAELILVIFVLQFIETIPNEFGVNLFSTITLSFGVPLLVLLFLKFKFLHVIYNYLIKTFNNVRKHNLFAYFITIIVLASVFMILTYMNLSTQIVLICNTVLIICFVVIVVKLINSKDKNRKITSKYETSIASLKQYEEMIDKYRIINHENKNQLLTIRNMVKTKDKKTLNYIDKLLEHKIKDNENIFNKTAKIPEGDCPRMNKETDEKNKRKLSYVV